MSKTPTAAPAAPNAPPPANAPTPDANLSAGAPQGSEPPPNGPDADGLGDSALPTPDIKEVMGATVSIANPGAAILAAESETVRLLEELNQGPLAAVLVPKAFNFTMNDHRVVRVDHGRQVIPAAWIEHWFVKAQGVTAL